MQEQEEEISIQDQIQKLNHITQILINKPPFIDPHIRDYVARYVQNHTLSDSFFTQLCENRILDIMLENQNRLNSPVCILECLNLLLVNTRQPNQLVYFFSNNSLHQYLFTKNLNKDSQYIQYLAQLMKTILLRINQSTDSGNLIRLFYNVKYFDFPIFTYSALLATQNNQLVKVTAQQCILLVVKLCNEGNMDCSFLGELPMLYMIKSLIQQFQNKKCDQQGLFKYMADLFYELRGLRGILLLINNFIFNYMCTRNLMKNYLVPLKFFNLLSQSITNKIIDVQEENKLIKQQVADLLIICACHLRVFIKYLTNKYLSGHYLATIISFSQHQISTVKYDKNTILKYFKEYIPQFSNYPNRFSTIQKQSSYFYDHFIEEMNNKCFQFGKSAQLQKIKAKYYQGNSDQTYVKAIGNAFGMLYKKTQRKDPFQEQAKQIWQFAGFSDKKKLPSLQNFMKILQPGKSVFICEFCFINKKILSGCDIQTFSLGQDDEKTDEQQNIFNNWRSVWGFSFEVLNILYMMTQNFVKFVHQNKHPQILLPKIYVHHSYLFLMQLKDYFEASMNQIFDDLPKNNQMLRLPNNIIIISKICMLLDVKLSEHASKIFAYKIHYLHGYIQGLLFENCFQAAIKYFGIRYLIFSKSFQEALPFVKDKQQRILVSALCFFECFQKILNPNHKMLTKFYESKWNQRVNSETRQIESIEKQAKLFQCIAEYKQKRSQIQIIKNHKIHKIMLSIRVDSLLVIGFDLCTISQTKKNTYNKNILQIGSLQNQAIKFDKIQDLQKFIQKFNECKLQLTEIVTSTMVQYFQHTYSQQCTHKFFQVLKKKKQQEQEITPTG